jgi:D-3-phosphoglycerate dehydrogenase
VSTAFTPRLGQGPFKRALIIENPDLQLDDHLRAIGVEPVRPAKTPNEDELVKLLENDPYDLIFKRSRVEITPRVLDAGKNLFGVMLCCIGDDSVDKQACAERGVLVTNDPISNGRSVAEMVIGELICLSRRIFEAARETRDGVFQKSQERRYEIRGKTLGIFGLGNIGKQVAQLAEGLGMRIAFFDNRDVAREVGEALGYRYVPSLKDLFTVSDYVTAHISATDYFGRVNENIITADHFRAFADKSGDSPRIFINLARGSIHSAETLIEAVENGWVTRAMVDVFPEEPRGNELWVNPYAKHALISSTPHIGAATLEAQPRIARHVAETTRALSLYGSLRNCVYGPRDTIGIDSYDGVGHITTLAHTTARGVKKAIGDVIYEAGLSNLGNEHRDFDSYGIAYEVFGTDRAVDDAVLSEMIARAAALTGQPSAIRAVRRLRLGA